MDTVDTSNFVTLFAKKAFFLKFYVGKPLRKKMGICLNLGPKCKQDQFLDWYHIGPENFFFVGVAKLPSIPAISSHLETKSFFAKYLLMCNTY